jgi:hypothetical protein
MTDKRFKLPLKDTKVTVKNLSNPDDKLFSTLKPTE